MCIIRQQGKLAGIRLADREKQVAHNLIAGRSERNMYSLAVREMKKIR